MKLSKRTFYAAMLMLILLVCHIKPVYAAENIPIFVDNVPAYSEVSPFYSKDNLLVPARLISEELGATVDWQNEQISISSDDCQIVLYVGQNQAQVNGTSQNLSAPPQIVQGRLFVPLRFIGENLGARVLYRDEKIFLYSMNYDEKKFLYDGPDPQGPCMHKPNCIIYDNKTYFLENDTIKMRNNENNAELCLPIYNTPKVILAISQSGLVYTNSPAAYIQDKGTFYYNFATNMTTKIFVTPHVSNIASNFDDNGYFFFPGDSKVSFYNAIFSVDVDGSNIKEIFVEEPNYLINDIQSYNGWIYYISEVPVIQNYGIDYYAGALYRVRVDGTDRQRLTEEEHVSGSFSKNNNGISYEYGSDAKKGFLRFADMK